MTSAAAADTPASAPDLAADDGIDRLMVVLRESPGADKHDEALVPMDRLEVDLPGGRKAAMTPAWFQLIGDMHLRLVFDSPDSLRSARVEDLARLGLTPEAAVERAIRNVERAYGTPASTPWHQLMQVRGRSPDYDSSYFLDRGFWRELLARHPEGLVVAVPQHGGLLWTPAGDAAAVSALQRGVGALYDSSGDLRISSALYLFRDDRWTVFQRARPAQAT
ncbi:MAG TPA: hypothetical protein VF457_03080 [Burkholderiaceae bacterium]